MPTSVAEIASAKIALTVTGAAEAIASLTAVKSGLTGVGTAAQQTAGQTKTLQSALSGMLAGGAITAGVGILMEGLRQIGQALENDTQLSKDWQSALVNIANNSGLTNQEMATLSGTIADAAAHFGYAGDALKQVDEAAMHAANFGFKDAASQTYILDSALASAKSTGGDAAEITQLLSATLHEYNMSADQAAKVTDLIHLAASRADATFQEFASSSSRALGVAANLHVPIEQVTSALSALTQHGYSASEAQTQVVNILTHIVHPAAAAADEFDWLAQKTGHAELASQALIHTLADQGLTGILASLKDAYHQLGYNEEEATQETMKLLNAQRGGLGMATLLGQGANDYANNIAAATAVIKGDAVPTADSYARSLKTVQQQQDLAAASSEKLGRAIGDILLPMQKNEAESARIINAAETAFLDTLRQSGSVYAAAQAYAQAWGETQQQIAFEAADGSDKLQAAMLKTGQAAVASSQQQRLAFLTGQQAVSAATTAYTAAQAAIGNSNRAMTASTKNAWSALDDDTTKATRDVVNALGTMGKESGAKAQSAAGAMVAGFALLKEDLPPQFAGVRDQVKTLMQQTEGAGVDGIARMHAGIIQILQTMAKDSNVETASWAQQTLDNLNITDAAAQEGQSTGNAYLDSLINGADAGIPALNTWLTNLLKGMDVHQITEILGKEAGRKFTLAMEAQQANALQSAIKTAQAIASLPGAPAALVQGVAQMQAQLATLNADIKQGATDAGYIGAHIGRTREDMEKQVADTIKRTQQQITDARDSAAKHEAAHDRAAASAGAAAERRAAAQARAAENLARTQSISADQMIKDLGKAEVATVDSTKSIAQAYDDLVPILTARLPAGMEWLQADYKRVLDQLTSDTPPSLAAISQEFQSWNAKLLQSNNATWRLMAQSNADAYAQALQKQKEADQQKLDQANAAAKQLLQSQQQVLSGLGDLVTTAGDPAHSMGALMSKTVDLMDQVQAAKMPGLVDKLKGYWDQMAAGQQVDAAKMNADFGAWLDQMMATGDPKMMAIAQSYHDMWASMAADQKRAQDEAAIALGNAQMAYQNKLLADHTAWVAAMNQKSDELAQKAQETAAKMAQAQAGLSGSLGGAGAALFKGGSPADFLSQLAPLMDAAAQAGFGGLQQTIEGYLRAIAGGASVDMGQIEATIVATLQQLAQSTDVLTAAQARNALAQIQQAQAAAAYNDTIKAEQTAIAQTQAAQTALNAAMQAQQEVVAGLQKRYQDLQTEYQKWQSAQLAGTNAQNAQQAVLKQQSGILGLAQGALTGAGGNAGAALQAFQAQFGQIQSAQQQAAAALQAQIGGATGQQKTDLQARLDQLLAVQQGEQSAFQQAVQALQGGDAGKALQDLIAKLQNQSSQAGLLGGLIQDPLKDALKNLPQEYGFDAILKGQVDTQNAMAALTPEIARQTKALAAMQQSSKDLAAQLQAQQAALQATQAAQQAAATGAGAVAQSYQTMGQSVATSSDTMKTAAQHSFDGLFTDLTDLITLHNTPDNDKGVLGMWGTTPKSLLSNMYGRVEGGPESFRPVVKGAMSGVLTDVTNLFTGDEGSGMKAAWRDVVHAMAGDAQTQAAAMIKAANDVTKAWQEAAHAVNGTSGSNSGGQTTSGGTTGQSAQVGSNALIIKAGGPGQTSGSNVTYHGDVHYWNNVKVEDPEVDALLAKVARRMAVLNAGAGVG